MSHLGIGWKSFLGSENSTCNGLEVGICCVVEEQRGGQVEMERNEPKEGQEDFSQRTNAAHSIWGIVRFYSVSIMD